MDSNIGAPFSPQFFSDGKITAVDDGNALVEYRDKDGELKSALFLVSNPIGFEVGERVDVVLVDEFVFISKKERGCF